MINICNDYLSDKDFIIHMINHHQVAVDMSEQLKKTSNVPVMLHLAREISYTQKYEIWIMKMIADLDLPEISQDIDKFKQWNPHYNIECYMLSQKKMAKCHPHFFHTDKKMLQNLTDINFIHHMIPHHQIAIDMSKRILLHTKNSHIQEFANKIIRNQSYEIINMKNLLRNLSNNHIPTQFHSSLF